jgi:hypothetical protein
MTSWGVFPVMPAKAGIQDKSTAKNHLDFRLRGNDKGAIKIIREISIIKFFHKKNTRGCHVDNYYILSDDILSPARKTGKRNIFMTTGMPYQKKSPAGQVAPTGD